jgi:hypothetical protein
VGGISQGCLVETTASTYKKKMSLSGPCCSCGQALLKGGRKGDTEVKVEGRVLGGKWPDLEIRVGAENVWEGTSTGPSKVSKGANPTLAGLAGAIVFRFPIPH